MGKTKGSKRKAEAKIETGPLKLDFGCGKNKRDGFVGIDKIAFPGVDWTCDLTNPTANGWVFSAADGVTIPDGVVRNITNGGWHLPDESVDEAHASHFIEHLTGVERVRFMNELYRVLKPGAKATVITPHWASCRAYGDYTHQWPPVSEFWFYYLSKDWRDGNAPHNDSRYVEGGLACDFEATWGYSLHPSIVNRNQEYQSTALQFYKEAAQDTVATLVKK